MSKAISFKINEFVNLLEDIKKEKEFITDTDIKFISELLNEPEIIESIELYPIPGFTLTDGSESSLATNSLFVELLEIVNYNFLELLDKIECAIPEVYDMSYNEFREICEHIEYIMDFVSNNIEEYI